MPQGYELNPMRRKSTLHGDKNSGWCQTTSTLGSRRKHGRMLIRVHLQSRLVLGRGLSFWSAVALLEPRFAMSQLFDAITQELTDDRVAMMSRSINADPDQTRQAISAVMPVLVGALSRNTTTAEGTQSLHQALAKDHDGSFLDQFSTILGGSNPSEVPGVSRKTLSGSAILDHILGAQKGRVETGVSRATGLSTAQSMKLMLMLAPFLMGVLGRLRKTRELSPDELGGMVRENDRADVVTSSVLGRLFDQDGDGDFDLMDVIKFGTRRIFGRSS